MAAEIRDTRDIVVGGIIIFTANIQKSLNAGSVTQIIGILIGKETPVEWTGVWENALSEKGYTMGVISTVSLQTVEIFTPRELVVDQNDPTILCFKTGYPIGCLKLTATGTPSLYTYSAKEIQSHPGFVGARCFPNAQAPAQQAAGGGGKSKRSTRSIMGAGII